MNPTVISLIIAGVGFVSSVIASAFVSGTHWGQVRSELRFTSDRLAKIEGMFTLQIKDTSHNG